MLHIEILEKTKRGLRPFVSFPFALYRDDANWVPPMLKYQYDTLLSKGNALLHDGECRFFMLYDDERPVARLLAGVDRRLNERLRQSLGYISLFECEDNQEAAKLILDAGCSYLKALKVERVIGPTPPTVGDFGKGVLVQGFDGAPVFLNAYNPPYYEALFLAAGFTKHRDHLAYFMRLKDFDSDRLEPIIQRAQQRFGYSIQNVRLTGPDREKKLRDMVRVLHEAFPVNWEMNPPQLTDIENALRVLRRVYRPEMTVMAYAGERPIGLVVSFPDYNELIKKTGGRLFPFGWAALLLQKNAIRGARCAMQFVVPEYQNMAVNMAMLCRSVECSRRIGIEWVEGSTVDETDAVSVNNTERMGAKIYRVYRQYEKKL